MGVQDSILDEAEAAAAKQREAEAGGAPIDMERYLSDPQRDQYTQYRGHSEDRAGLQRFGKRPRALGQDYQTPAWRDSLLANMYIQYSNSPNRKDNLALAFFGQQEQGLEQRQYGNDLDSAYRRPDGSFDRVLIEQDKFVMKMEAAYYRTDGDIPLSWYADNASDLDLFEGASKEVLNILYGTGIMQQKRLASEAAQAEKFEREYQRSQETIAGPLLGNASPAAAEATINAIAEGLDYNPGFIPGANENFHVGRKYLWGKAGDLFNAIIPGSDPIRNNFDVLGETAPALAGGAGQVVAGAFAPYVPAADALMDRPRQVEEQKAILRAELGMSNEDFLTAGFPDALSFARELPELDPEAYAGWLAVAGGDHDMAIDFITDAKLNSKENQEFQLEQQRLYNDELNLQIQQLENNDFTKGERVLDILGAYGNFSETFTVGTILAGISIFGEKDMIFWDEQYVTDVDQIDTPAHILGLEGTLVGLLFNVTANGILALDNLFFSPAWRTGLNSFDNVGAVLGRGSTKSHMDDLIKIIRSGTHDGISAQAAADVLSATGSESRMFSAVRGHLAPVIGKRSGTLANVSGDVSLSMFDDLVPIELVDEGAALFDDAGKLRNLDDVMGDAESATSSTAVLERTAKRIETEGVSPIEITLNPDTGVQTVTRGADDVAYYRTLDNVDTVPATVILDETHGMVSSTRLANYSDEEAQLIHNIANGTKKAELVANKGSVGKPQLVAQARRVPREMAERADTWTDPELLADVVKKGGRVDDVGTVTHKTEGTFTVRRVEQNSEQFDYLIYDVDGKGVGAVSVNGDEITMGLRGDLKRGGIMDQVYDIALANQDDLLLKHGLSESTSVDAADFAISRAKKVIDDKVNDAFRTTVDPDAYVGEWGKGTSLDADGIVDVEDVLYINPNRIVPDEIRYGEVDIEEVMRIYERHLLMGGDTLNANKTALAAQIGSAFGNMVRSGGKLATWIDNYITPINANAHFDYMGSFGRQQINQFGARLYSAVGDFKGWEPFQMRVQQFYRAQGMLNRQMDDLTAQVIQIEREQEAVMRVVGGNLDDGASELGVTLDPEQAAIHRKATDANAVMEARKLALIEKGQDIQRAARDFSEMDSIMDDMMEDFNRRFIATRDDWADEVVDGLVPAEVLSNRKPGVLSREARIVERAKLEGVSLQEAAILEEGLVPKSITEISDVIDASGRDMGQIISDMSEVMQHKSSWVAPASPLELMAAATGGPKALRSVTARLTSESFAEGLNKVHTFWVLDKVLTPRTGITVSMDELISGFHAGGTASVWRYAEDKAIRLADGIASKKGTDAWDKLPQRWKDRLTTLEEYPIHFRQQERAFLEMSGVGFDEIKFGAGNADEYYEAAQRTAQGFIGDPGFQAYLEGPEALEAWFRTDTTAARLRSLEFYDVATKKTRTGLTIEDVRNGYETVEGWMTMGLKGKNKGKAMAEYRKAALRAADKGSTVAGPVQLPDWVLEGYTSVTGNINVTKGPAKLINQASNAVFQRPLNYRRGWEASMVREFEKARLEKLFRTQGKTIISEQEMRSMLRMQYPGYSEDTITAGIPHLSQQMFERHDVVSQRYIDELIEQKVIHELESRMYSFTMESKAGRQFKAVAPFGKPYADMVGRWSRDLFSRPQLRGWVNNTNFLNMSNIANKAVDQLPINPKTAGFLSRIANTEFDLDRIQEDPIVGRAAQAIGLESLDLSAGLFLPHQGDNPFGVLFPGLGYVPVFMIQLVFNWMAPDAVEEPLEYQKYTDEWSEWVPALGFSKPQGLAQTAGAAFFGGGTAAKTMQAAEALNFMFTGADTGASPLQQSWKPRIAADRQVKQILTSAEFLDELADLPDDLMDAGISSLLDETLGNLTKEANRAQGAAALKELATEISVPVRATYDSVNDNLAEVWIESVEWMGLEIPEYIQRSRTGNSSPDADRRAADWARNQFFDLPDWERDAVVSDNPGLAVNLVSMWEWTDQGKNAIIPENNLAYRTGGSTTDFARHESYLNLGYIQPLGPKALAVNIIGTMLTAKERTAKAAYTEAASTINEERWASFTPEQQAWFDDAAESYRVAGDLPYRTGKELWRNYADLKIAFDTQNPPDPDNPDDTGFSIPVKFRAWGEEMPSSKETLREEFEEGQWTIKTVTPKLAKLAAALGLDWDENSPDDTIEMNAIYIATAESISTNRLDNPIFAHVDAGYRNWLSPRSAGQQAFTGHFGKILDGQEFNAETRALYKQNQVYIGEALDRRAEGDPSWRTVRDQAVEQFSRMVQDDAFRNQPTSKLWDDAYGRTLGSLDWEPDTPAPLFLDDEEKLTANPNASQVYVRRVLDGDTLDVSFGTGWGGGAKTYRVRLLGWNAKELGNGGEAEKASLETAIQDAIERGTPIAVVRDPERYGNTDMYGRLFAWLYIGPDPWYNADTMIPRKN